MDLHKMIVELQAERLRLNEAIEALEKLSAGKMQRRTRTPRWLREEIEKQSLGPEDGEPEPAAKKNA